MNGIPIEDINDDEGYADVPEAIIIDAYEERSTRYNLDDPAYHFLPSVDRIMSEGYQPTLSDILSIRIPTTGKINFFTNRNLGFTIGLKANTKYRIIISAFYFIFEKQES